MVSPKLCRKAADFGGFQHAITQALRRCSAIYHVSDMRDHAHAEGHTRPPGDQADVGSFTRCASLTARLFRKKLNHDSRALFLLFFFLSTTLLSASFERPRRYSIRPLSRRIPWSRCAVPCAAIHALSRQRRTCYPF